MPPAFMLWRRKGDVQERAPLRALWFANETHARFLGQPVAFARVTRNARANHVFPRRRPAAIARHDVIEIQIVAIEKLAAVLTGVLVTLENVVTRELNLLLGQPIEKEQHDHARDANLPGNRRNQFVVRRGRGEIPPTVEIMRQEIVLCVRRDDVGVSSVDERKRAARRADVDRLPQAIQHQDLTV